MQTCMRLGDRETRIPMLNTLYLSKWGGGQGGMWPQQGYTEYFEKRDGAWRQYSRRHALSQTKAFRVLAAAWLAKR